MKRSKMQSIISNEIEGYVNPTSAYRIADEILKAIEEAGMLPPNTMRYIDQESGNTLCSEVCEWDSEND